MTKSKSPSSKAISYTVSHASPAPRPLGCVDSVEWRFLASLGNFARENVRSNIGYLNFSTNDEHIHRCDLNTPNKLFSIGRNLSSSLFAVTPSAVPRATSYEWRNISEKMEPLAV